MTTDISMLNSMKEAKEKQLERRNEAMKKNMPKGSVKPLTPTSSETGKQGYLNPISNIT